MIRWMISRDMPGVLDVEKSVLGTWVEEDFRNYNRCRNSIASVVYGRNDEEVVGYMLYTLKKNSFTLDKFAVHAHCQRLGYGTQILNKLKSKLSHQRRKFFQIFVPEDNLDCQLFLKANGLIATGVVEGTYRFIYQHKKLESALEIS